MDGVVETLTIAEIVEINRRMVLHFGGIYFEGDNNLANRGSLEHVLEEINGALFGQDLYPDIFQKAALLAWRIIVGHVFHDGNKRTGMESCRLYLEMNGYNLKMNMEIVIVAIKIATHEIEFDAFANWLRIRSTAHQ